MSRPSDSFFLSLTPARRGKEKKKMLSAKFLHLANNIINFKYFINFIKSMDFFKKLCYNILIIYVLIKERFQKCQKK